MTFVDLFDMTVAYVQYLYLIISLSPESFPDIILEPLENFKVVLLHLSYTFFTGDSQERYQLFTLPSWIPHDSRLNYTFIVVVVPMLLSLTGLLIVSSTGAFACFFAQVVALFFAVLGAVLRFLPRKDVFMDRQTQELLVYLGGAGFVTLIIAGLIYLIRFHKGRGRKKKLVEVTMDQAVDHEDETPLIQKAVRRVTQNKKAMAALLSYEAGKESYIQERKWLTIIVQLFMCCAGVALGCFILSKIPREDPDDPVNIGRYDNTVVVGFVCASGITVLWALLSICEGGRRVQVKIMDKLSKVLISTALIALSIAFTPVTLNMMRLLLCTEVVCSEGEMLIKMKSAVEEGGKFSSSWDTWDKPCLTCNFTEHPQKCSRKLQEKLCGGGRREKRLAYDPRVPCRDIDKFYKVSMSLVFVAYFVAYPAFLILAIDRATHILVEEYPLEKRICDEFSKRELYYEKIFVSKNVSTSLYVAYKYRFRRSRILFLLQRMMLVLIGMLIRRGPGSMVAWLGISLITCICLLYLSYILMARPYARPVENWYGTSHQMVLTFVGSIGIVGSIWSKELVPKWVTIFVVALMIVAPLFALIVGSVLTFRMDRERVERLQKRLKRDFASVADTGGNQASGHAHPSENVGCSKHAEDDRTEAATGLLVCVDGTGDDGLQKFNSAAMKSLTDANMSVALRGSKRGSFSQAPETVMAASMTAAGGMGETKQASAMKQGGEEEWAPPADGDDREMGSAVLLADDREAAGETDKHKIDKDDYFDGKRHFEPREFFSGYRQIPLSWNAAEWGGGDDELFDKTAIKRGELKSALSKLILSDDGRVDGDKDAGGATVFFHEVEDQGDAVPHVEGDDDTQQQKNEASNRRSRFSSLLGWVQRWKRAFHSGMFLHYDEVLRARKTLNKDTGAVTRPFWITPTQTQLLMRDAVGCDVPSLHRKEEEEEGSPKSQDNDSFFSKLMEHKKVYWRPLVGSAAAAGIVSGASQGGTGTEGDSGVANGIPTVRSVVTEYLPVANAHDTDVRSETLGDEVLDHLAIALTKEELCALLADLKAEDLDRLRPRDLKDSYTDERRSSVYPPFSLRVFSGEEDVEGGGDWDAFVQRLLEDVQDPLDECKKDAGREETESSEVTRSASVGRRQSVVLDASFRLEGSPLVKKKSWVALSATNAVLKDVLERDAENMRRLRRHHVLRQQLVDEYNAEADRLASLQMAVDRRIAMNIRRYMQLFFVALSLFSTLSLAMCIGGMMYKGEQNRLFNAQSAYSRHEQLLGYPSWERFTHSCCCSSVSGLRPTPPNNVIALERWVCRNKMVKERVRHDVYRGEDVDGYKIRPLCGMEFLNGCQLKLHPKGNVEIQNCTVELTDEEVLRW